MKKSLSHASVDCKSPDFQIGAALRRPVWHGGQLMAYSGLEGPTDFAGALTLRTSFGVPGLDIMLPALGRIVFPRPTTTDNVFAGDWFSLGTDIRGVFLDTFHLLIKGPCDVASLAPGLSCAIRGDLTLIGASPVFDAALIATDVDHAIAGLKQWLQGRTIPPGLPVIRQETLIKAMSVMKTQVYTPEGRILHRWTTPDRWPHRRMWLWDSVFHAIGWRHLDPELARDSLDAVLDMQAPDGFVAHMMDPSSVSHITQPPILALGVQQVYRANPVPGWIGAVYPKLCAYLEWDMANRDRDGAGLLEWAIEGDPFCRSGESGMDNSPRFDAATQMDAVDFNSFLALECEIMASFATQLGREADAKRWTARHENLCRLIVERLWSDELGFFVDYDNDRKMQSPVLASSGFLPLICGAASPAQAGRLAALLQDPGKFGTALPVPSISVCDKASYSKDMWRGPVWINLNWLIALGFERYGMNEIAKCLREKTMQEVERACEKFGVMFEFYDDRRETEPPDLLRKGVCREGGNPAYHQVFHDYGWTATLYVDMVYTTNRQEE